MNDWTLGSFLTALMLVILGGAAVGFVVQRLWFRDMRAPDMGELFVQRQRNKFRSSLGVLVGLAIVLLIYPLSCRIGGGFGLDLNFLGLSDEWLTFLIILVPGMGVPLYLAWRDKRR